ncbi:hypothetical protein [Herbidospora sp. RD11066]
MTRSRNYQVLAAARAVARALGHDPADANLLAVELAAEGRLDWDNSELLLLALERLTHLAGPAEAAEILDPPDLPEPAYTLATGPLWSREELRERQAGR